MCLAERSDLYLLNKLVSEILTNSKAENIRKAVREEVRKTQSKVFCMPKIIRVGNKKLSFPRKIHVDELTSI